MRIRGILDRLRPAGAPGEATRPGVPVDRLEPLRAELAPLSLGSDHEVYNDSSFAIPAVYFNDWPDRWIHTDRDVAANLDATKLGRAAFLAALMRTVNE